MELSCNRSVSAATGLAPNEVTWTRSRASLLLFITAPVSTATIAWSATTSHIVTWHQNANSAPMVV